MTWTQKQPGLRKPANRTAKVRAVDGENLESITLDVSDPARGVRGFAIGWIYMRIPESCESRLSFWKLAG
jgi:hypothetical protein